jgi:PhnB protein
MADQQEASEAPAITGVVACLMVADTDAAIRFWERAFGAREVNRIMADDGRRVMHARVLVNGGQVIVNDPFPEHGYPFREITGVTMHLQVPHAREAFARAVEAGAEVVMPMRKEFWGDLYGQVKDPAGVKWSIGGAPGPED